MKFSRCSASPQRIAATLFSVASAAFLCAGTAKSAHAQDSTVYRVDIGRRDSVLTTSITEVKNLLTNGRASTVTKLGRLNSAYTSYYSQPLYRLYDSVNNKHVATNSPSSYTGYQLEGLIGYYSPSDPVAIYRFKNTDTNINYYTTTRFSIAPSNTGSLILQKQYWSNVLPTTPSHPALWNIFDAMIPQGNYSVRAWSEGVYLAELLTP